MAGPSPSHPHGIGPGIATLGMAPRAVAHAEPVGPAQWAARALVVGAIVPTPGKARRSVTATLSRPERR